MFLSFDRRGNTVPQRRTHGAVSFRKELELYSEKSWSCSQCMTSTPYNMTGSEWRSTTNPVHVMQYHCGERCCFCVLKFRNDTAYVVEVNGTWHSLQVKKRAETSHFLTVLLLRCHRAFLVFMFVFWSCGRDLRQKKEKSGDDKVFDFFYTEVHNS